MWRLIAQATEPSVDDFCTGDYDHKLWDGDAGYAIYGEDEVQYLIDNYSVDNESPLKYDNDLCSPVIIEYMGKLYAIEESDGMSEELNLYVQV